MNVQLGIVRACLGDGCRVRLLETGAQVDVRLDRRATGRIRLRYGFLAAVDLCEAPALLWHWQRAQVLIWRADSVLAVLPEGRMVECHPAGWMPEGASAAQEIWVTRVADRWESHDTVLHGRPAHPQALIEWLVAQPVAQQA